MNERMGGAFDGIRAEEQLKKKTLNFLKGEMQRSSKKHRGPKNGRLIAAFACLLTLTFAGAFSYGIYFTDAMYVDVDINPSIELTVNRYKRVIGAYAYNADGEALLSRLELMHKPYDSAVTMLTESAIQNGFLPDGGLVSVTLQSGGGADEMIILGTLQTNILSVAQGHHASVQIDAFSVDRDTREHSHEQNLSPAKYLAILELQEVDPTATVEGCRNHTIGQIRERTEEHGGGRHGHGHNCNGHRGRGHK